MSLTYHPTRAFLRFLSLVTLLHPGDSSPWYNQTGHLYGPFADDWIPMNLTEALDYGFTMYEVCKIAGHTTCNSPISPNLVLDGGSNESCGIHELPNIHSGAMCGNLPGNLLHHVNHQPWPSTRGFLDLMAHMIARGDDTLLLIGTSTS